MLSASADFEPIVASFFPASDQPEKGHGGRTGRNVEDDAHDQ